MINCCGIHHWMVAGRLRLARLHVYSWSCRNIIKSVNWLLESGICQNWKWGPDKNKERKTESKQASKQATVQVHLRNLHFCTNVELCDKETDNKQKNRHWGLCYLEMCLFWPLRVERCTESQRICKVCRSLLTHLFSSGSWQAEGVRGAVFGRF